MFATKFAVVLVASSLAGTRYVASGLDLEASSADEMTNPNIKLARPVPLDISSPSENEASSLSIDIAILEAAGLEVGPDVAPEPDFDFDQAQAAAIDRKLQKLDHSLAHEEPVSAIQTDNLAGNHQAYTLKAKNYMETAFRNAQNLRTTKTLNNDRYQDPGWWALLWTVAYNITQKETYLEEAEQLLDVVNYSEPNFCSQASGCSKTPTHPKTPIQTKTLSGFMRSLAQITRMSGGSWFGFERSPHKNDSAAVEIADTEGKTELKERNSRECSERNPTVPKTESNVMGGFIEHSTEQSMTLNEVHTLAGVIATDMARKTSSGEPELHHDRRESQFNPVFEMEIQELPQALPNDKYQRLLKSNLNIISQQAQIDGNGSASWVGPCFPLTSTAQDWICWALILH